MMSVLLPLPLALFGCAALDELSKSGTNGAAFDTGVMAPGAGDDGASGAGDGDLPPEEEADPLRLLPASTATYVFVANPDRDTVTRIAVPSLAVSTAAVGAMPTVVRTTADAGMAVTLNEGDDTLSIVDAESMAVASVPLRPNFNALSLSGDGQWALAWYDPDAESRGLSGGVQSFNEVSLVHLPSRTHFPMAVGFNPRGVRWSEDGTLAVIVSDAALASLDLTLTTPRPVLVDLVEDAAAAPPAEEVELAPDGGFAFVRQFGSDAILAVDLATRQVEPIAVGENPTDLDMAPDGRTLAVVSRGAQELWVLDALNPFGDAEVVDLPDAYGSLHFAGHRAILTTNAAALPRFGVWDRLTGEVVERTLVKPVASVGVSGDGERLLVFHTRGDAVGADAGSPFTNRWALTLVDLTDFRQNPMVLPAEPSGYAVSDDGNYGFFVMDGRRLLEVLDFDTLLYEEIALPSEPVHLGVLPGSRTAWVSQLHALGRLSFYDAATGALDTLTGFELNAGIQH
jgi:DNA-binding beta-propeller fold protein YncE